MNKPIFPKISVITVVFNGADFLEKTIKSVLAQNYPNLEYIIIDGGSTDGSLKIIKKYEKQLAYWISEKDKGMYDALNKGFAKATGDILCWLNSDDEFYTTALLQVAKIFTDLPNVNWITGCSTTINEDSFINDLGYAKHFSKYDFQNSDYHFIQQESTFWRKSLMKRLGSKPFDLSVKYAGDFNLWFKFFQLTDLYFVNVPLGKFRTRKTQLSKSHMGEYFKECDKIILDYKHTKEDNNNLKKLRKINFLIRVLNKINRIFGYSIFDTTSIKNHFTKRDSIISLNVDLCKYEIIHKTGIN